jgi:3-oxoacyl-[acyl-carrier protein] reductase
MSGRLSGKFALVTGAGGGLGAATAELFAREGAVVGVNDINAENAEAVADRCRSFSARSRAFVCDVSDSHAVHDVFAEIEREWGRLDVLVNNAGVSAATDVGVASDTALAPLAREISDISDEHWRRMMGVHLDGSFFCTREAVPLMKRTASGSIVCIASIAGLAGLGPLHYAAAKGGILGMVKALARTVGPYGIRVNAVSPGAIDAGMAKLYPPERQAEHIGAIPLRRLGAASDIAYAVLHLACDESAYTTGQQISPNGGLVIL